MKFYISINGVLRNLIDRIDYIYNAYYINSEKDESDNFLYEIAYPIKNNNLINYFKFHTKEEFDQFLLNKNKMIIDAFSTKTRTFGSIAAYKIRINNIECLDCNRCACKRCC